MKNQANIGEYFADYDEGSAMWCIFHTDKNTGFAYGSYSTEQQAIEAANARNGK